MILNAWTRRNSQQHFFIMLTVERLEVNDTDVEREREGIFFVVYWTLTLNYSLGFVCCLKLWKFVFLFIATGWTCLFLSSIVIIILFISLVI